MEIITILFTVTILFIMYRIYKKEKYRRWLIKAIYYTSPKEEMDKINKYIKLKGGYLTVSTLEDIIHGKHNK